MQTRHTVQNINIPESPKIQVLKKSSYTGDLLGALD